HRILQLVAKSERAARLIIAAAAPQATRQYLIRQPAVGQHVKRWIGRLHLHGAECPLPVLWPLSQRVASRHRAAETLDHLASIVPVAPDAKAKNDLGNLALPQLEWNADRAAGVERRSDPPRELRPAHRR